MLERLHLTRPQYEIHAHRPYRTVLCATNLDTKPRSSASSDVPRSPRPWAKRHWLPSRHTPARQTGCSGRSSTPSGYDVACCLMLLLLSLAVGCCYCYRVAAGVEPHGNNSNNQRPKITTVTLNNMQHHIRKESTSDLSVSDQRPFLKYLHITILFLPLIAAWRSNHGFSKSASQCAKVQKVARSQPPRLK